MFRLFKSNFKTTNDCIILATPLIIFLSILGWYFDYAKNSVDNIPKLILAFITILIMIAGCCSAWFYMTKKTLSLANKVFVFDKDRIKAFQSLILSLPKGIGRFFLSFLGVISLTGLTYSIVFIFAAFIINKYVGTIDIEWLTSDNLLISTKELLEEISTLSNEELITINCWYLLVTAISTILSFFTIFWIPEIIYSEKNPYKALFNSIKKVFITFSKSFFLFIYINIIIAIVTILNTLLLVHPIAYFFVLLLYYYFLVYIVVLIFSYYEQTFIKKQ
ncbi:hypothetical protein HDR58_03460 [bacterium]|nr:hypothetical protein [bacterium]